MSKGGIYHHFRSKEDVLQAIIDRKQDYERGLFRSLIASIQAKSAKDKIQKILSAFLSRSAGSYDSINKSILLSKMKDPQLVVANLQSSVADLAPILSELFAEGIEDGSIQTEYPLEYAEIFMMLFSIWMKPFLFERDAQQTEARLQALRQLMIRLGADIISEEIIRQIMAFYDSKEMF
jgi:AcrR family transcriptional regulator